MSQSGEQRRYTLGEFFSLAGDERMELYEGTIVLMSPAPYEHEGVVANLIAEFRMALKGSPCLVFGSNLQVVLLFEDEQKGTKNVTVLPDLSIICDRTKLRQGRCYGAPDLVVEVLSPSTARNDRLLKRHYYEKAGVRE
ncbi:Uma2 family endonuclease [Geobacillus sp. YHL]|nr:Uma2 family endonuclease [Geobacillus sp. YHL]